MGEVYDRLSKTIIIHKKILKIYKKTSNLCDVNIFIKKKRPPNVSCV